jgi:hypothetical protein
MKEIAPGVWYNMESKKKFRAKRNDSAIELNPYDGIILKQLK